MPSNHLTIYELIDQADYWRLVNKRLTVLMRASGRYSSYPVDVLELEKVHHLLPAALLGMFSYAE